MTLRRLHTPRSLQPFDAATPACCVGHRGARAFAPENTLAAFRKAASMGCTMVELDVHPSRDGELVVHHDDRLVRCTDAASRLPRRNGDFFISDFSLAELRSLDAGRWYMRELALPAAQRQPFLRSLGDAEIAHWVRPDEAAHYASGEVGIPTLREVLDLARELDLLVNIEIKSIPRMYEGIARRVLDVLVELGVTRSVLVSSFDHEQLVELRRLDADLMTGVLSSDRLARPAEYLHVLDADAYHPGCDGDFDSLGFNSASGRLDARGIREVRQAGGLVFAWTCNEPRQMRELVDAGVSGVITDFPNRFAALRESGI